MTAPQQVVRASTPAQWLTLVPYLVGFPPRESVVILGIGGPNGKRVVLTLRVDAPLPKHAAKLARHVLEPLRRSGARKVQFFLFRDADGRPDEADIGIHDVCRDVLADAFEWRDALVVRGGRWFSLPGCADTRCCPPAGRPLPAPDARTAAELVYAGKSVAESRESIAARLESTDPDDLRRVTRLCEIAGDEFVDVMVRGRAAVHEWGRGARNAWRQLLLDPPPEPLDPRFVACFLVGCTWLPIRDAFGQVADRYRDRAIPLLTELTRRSPERYVAAPATLLGLIASLTGDGALANMAFARALRADPEYRFARMLDAALAHGVRMPDGMLRAAGDPLAPLTPAAVRRASRRAGRASRAS